LQDIDNQLRAGGISQSKADSLFKKKTAIENKMKLLMLKMQPT